MKSFTMKWSIWILLWLIILNITPIFYFNIFSHSLPYGIYMKIKGSPNRGEYAATCLTSDLAQYGILRGYLVQGACVTGTVKILKMIKGIPGDHFKVKNEFLELNGHSYRILSSDSSKRPLKVFYRDNEGIVGSDEYILLSDFAINSWDSRYWGPVRIEFLLKPLLIFDKNK